MKHASCALAVSVVQRVGEKDVARASSKQQKEVRFTL